MYVRFSYMTSGAEGVITGCTAPLKPAWREEGERLKRMWRVNTLSFCQLFCTLLITWADSDEFNMPAFWWSNMIKVSKNVQPPGVRTGHTTPKIENHYVANSVDIVATGHKLINVWETLAFLREFGVHSVSCNEVHP